MAKGGKPTNDAIERDAIWKAFHEAVNLTRTEESRSVGWTHQGESESVGHGSGPAHRKNKASQKS